MKAHSNQRPQKEVDWNKEGKFEKEGNLKKGGKFDTKENLGKSEKEFKRAQSLLARPSGPGEVGAGNLVN